MGIAARCRPLPCTTCVPNLGEIEVVVVFFNVQISEYRTAANLTYVKANGLAKMMGEYSFFWLLWTDWTASR